MDIRIIQDVSAETNTGAAIQSLVRTQLGNEQSLRATLSQIGYDSGKALIIGGFVGGELATMNAFMPQAFLRGKNKIVGYQSGFSATDGQHRGKGYWPMLMTASMDLLRSKEAHFIYGFPNPTSQPLFEKKLGFATAPMSRVVLPAIIGRFVNFENQQTNDYYLPNFRELSELKRRSDVEIIHIDADGCFAFGKVRSARGFRLLDIGGMTSEHGKFNTCIRLICKAAKAHLFRYETSPGSEFQGGFWPRRTSRPVIFKSLNGTLAIGDISFVGGLADNY